MSERPPRVYLGSVRSWGDRSRIYSTPEALEVDLIDHYEVRRRRVFFDEVQLVTLHETRVAGPYPWILGFLSLIWIISALPSPPPVRYGFLIAGAVFLVGALVLIASPVWIVTAFGKRSRAQIRFRWREARARSVYADICRASSEAQRALARRAGPSLEEPPPLPGLPLSESDALPLPPA
jgi:hypothetical protein